VDALDEARDELVGMVDATITSLSGADVRPILDILILKVSDVKLATLLRESSTPSKTSNRTSAYSRQTQSGGR
jgi:hypothetical protein